MTIVWIFSKKRIQPKVPVLQEVRLSKEDANALFEEDTIEFQQYLKPALTKLSRLQTACRRAGVGATLRGVSKSF